MRSLTEAEGRVIGTLLGGQHRTDRGGYTAAGVPRTTFQVVRQRAFDSGWIREGYIPNPAVFGGAKLDFRLRQPFAEEWVSDTRSGTSPGTLTVWGSPELILTVTLLRGKEAELGEESRVTAHQCCAISTSRAPGRLWGRECPRECIHVRSQY
jgi:hypothetical protein